MFSDIEEEKTLALVVDNEVGGVIYISTDART